MRKGHELMAARHHRTVDRLASILEHVAHQPRGLSLSDLAKMLEAPKTSLHALVNGLVATGYLVEQGRRYFLGPGPFVLTLMVSPLAARRIRHADLVALHAQIGQNILIGIQVGDTLVYIDQAGDGPMMEFLAYSHRRRPLLTTATGKVILAGLPTAEMQGILAEAGRETPAAVERFLEELPAIRRSKLAFNRGNTLPDLFAVATGLYDADGRFVAAICANGGPELANRLEEVGKDLVQAATAWVV